MCGWTGGSRANSVTYGHIGELVDTQSVALTLGVVGQDQVELGCIRRVAERKEALVQVKFTKNAKINQNKSNRSDKIARNQSTYVLDEDVEAIEDLRGLVALVVLGHEVGKRTTVNVLGNSGGESGKSHEKDSEDRSHANGSMALPGGRMHMETTLTFCSAAIISLL